MQQDAEAAFESKTLSFLIFSLGGRWVVTATPRPLCTLERP